MAGENTVTTLASRFKIVYPNGITELIPTSTVLMQRLKYDNALQLGKQADFDVQLSHEHGFTVGVDDLNNAVAQTSATATVNAGQIVLRSRVSYEAIERAKDSKSAFARFNSEKFVPMVESFRKREEIYAVYGRDGLGKVQGVSGQVITITAGTWAPSLWLGTEGLIVEAFTSKAASATQHNTDITIASVATSTRELTVTGTIAAVVADDHLYYKGDRTTTAHRAPVGLMSIARNTGSLYGISATTYALWSANSYNVGTTSLTLAKVLEAAAKAADKGCDEKLTCLVPVSCFQTLVSDQAALRRYDGSYSKSKLENGAESLSFFGATGVIEILPYMFMKQGEFVMFPERHLSRIGFSEMKSSIGKDGDIVFDVENSTNKEMRLYAGWTVFCDRPGWIVYGERSDGGVL